MALFEVVAAYKKFQKEKKKTEQVKAACKARTHRIAVKLVNDFKKLDEKSKFNQQKHLAVTAKLAEVSKTAKRLRGELKKNLDEFRALLKVPSRTTEQQLRLTELEAAHKMKLAALSRGDEELFNLCMGK